MLSRYKDLSSKRPMGQKHMEYLVDSFLHVLSKNIGYNIGFNVILRFKGFMDGENLLGTDVSQFSLI